LLSGHRFSALRGCQHETALTNHKGGGLGFCVTGRLHAELLRARCSCLIVNICVGWSLILRMLVLLLNFRGSPIVNHNTALVVNNLLHYVTLGRAVLQTRRLNAIVALSVYPVLILPMLPSVLLGISFLSTCVPHIFKFVRIV
jgi:hypothetical protein